MPIMPLSRKDLELRYLVFDKFALNDQRSYYDSVRRKHRKASTQVNRLRALLAVFTGVAAAAAALLVATSFGTGDACNIDVVGELPSWCSQTQFIINVLTVLAIILPAFAAMFNTLADLYQWNRLIAIYKDASENIELADAQSPDEHLTDESRFRAALMAYAEGTLSVMSDETAQWGQAIRTPPQLEEFLHTAQTRSDQAARSLVAQRAGAAATTSSSNTAPPTSIG
jgi:hypothetical protein